MREFLLISGRIKYYSMNPADELIYANDLRLLGYILGEMADVVMMLEENQDKVKLLAALNDFYAIHKTRTYDLLQLQKSVNIARAKHQKVISERDQYKSDWKSITKRLEDYMQSSISKAR